MVHIPGDIKYFDGLPAPIKQLLNDGPKPFSAKMARQLLDRGYSVSTICDMLRGAFEDEIHDGTMAPMKRFEPLKRSEARSRSRCAASGKTAPITRTAGPRK